MIEYIRQAHLISQTQNDRRTANNKGLKKTSDPQENMTISTFSPKKIISNHRELTKNNLDAKKFDLNKPLTTRVVMTNKQVDIAVPKKFELEFIDTNWAFSCEVKIGLINTDVFIVSNQTSISVNFSLNKIGFQFKNNSKRIIIADEKISGINCKRGMLSELGQD
jgi:hypothetical protein